MDLLISSSLSTILYLYSAHVLCYLIALPLHVLVATIMGDVNYNAAFGRKCGLGRPAWMHKHKYIQLSM